MRALRERTSLSTSLSLSLSSIFQRHGGRSRRLEGRRGEREGRKGEETVRQTDVETEAGDGGSARRNRDEGNELKREDPRWRTNDWWKKGGGGGASKRGDTPTVERNTSQEVLLVSPRLEAMTAVAGELAWDNGTRLARYPHRGERAATKPWLRASKTGTIVEHQTLSQLSPSRALPINCFSSTFVSLSMMLRRGGRGGGCWDPTDLERKRFFLFPPFFSFLAIGRFHCCARYRSVGKIARSSDDKFEIGTKNF